MEIQCDKCDELISIEVDIDNIEVPFGCTAQVKKLTDGSEYIVFICQDCQD